VITRETYQSEQKVQVRAGNVELAQPARGRRHDLALGGAPAAAGSVPSFLAARHDPLT
jgi:hypothetical protein